MERTRAKIPGTIEARMGINMPVKKSRARTNGKYFLTVLSNLSKYKGPSRNLDPFQIR